MFNRTETEEKQYLEDIKAKLSGTLSEIHHKVTNRARDAYARFSLDNIPEL